MTTPINPSSQTVAVIPAPKREIRVVEDDSPLAYIMDTAKFEHCYRIAEAMSRASLIPQHLKGGTKEETAANCFLVVNQALRWHMDPFLIAPETYSIQGKLGYQGKLVAAVINTRAGLAEKLRYDFSGEKGTDNFTVTVSGRFEGEAEPRTVSVSVGQAKTQNQMWAKDPEQKLVYTGSIRWARRHAPEVIMGVVTDDDLDAVREQAMIDGMKQVKSPSIPEMMIPPGTEVAVPAETLVRTTEGIKKRNKRTLVEEPLDQKPVEFQAEPATNPTAAPPSSQVPETVPPTNETPEAALLRELLTLAKESNITVEQLTKFCLHPKQKWLDSKRGQSNLNELSGVKLKLLTATWKENRDEFTKRVMAHQQ
jgi:hypothetical protein